jgi:hypothetical protein
MAPRDHSDHAASRVRSSSRNSPAIPCRCTLRHRVRARRQDLVGGAGGIELHLRPLQRGLDRRPCRCAQLPGRGPEGARGGATAPTTESAPVLRLSRPPNAPRSTTRRPPSAVDLWSEVVYRDLLFPKEQVPASTPIPPARSGPFPLRIMAFFASASERWGAANARVCRQCCSTGWDVWSRLVVDFSRRSLAAPPNTASVSTSTSDSTFRFATPPNMPVSPWRNSIKAWNGSGVVVARLDQNQKRRQLQSAAFLASHDPCLNRLEWIPAQCRACARAPSN